MAKKIIHPFHRQHPLALLPMPAAYSKARFRCEACGKTGKGFSYNCKLCRISLHVFCAQLPLSVTHISHTKHSLDLTFESPYRNNKFSCDICRCLGNSRDWLYRCKSCEFDAHVNCARGVPPTIPSPLEPNDEKPPATCSISSPSAPLLQQQQPNVMNDPPFEVNVQKDELTLKLLQQLISDNVSAVAHALLSGGGDSSGGVNNRGLHQLIQLISDNNSHSSGGSQEDGGEGGQEYSFQALQIDDGGGGSGGDGGDVAGDNSDLQAAVIEGDGDGDGGISGVDPIQSLLEDGDTIDVFTGLLGGFTF
ncbi:hypothetical protein ABFS82_02G125100 [Erythranthe guttata]|uniref:DC1 domain-containing protein n=1 Tax=Erythranthe guttata TaxID=4155 RepID=A0A022QEL1_ERYGU|nr:PREDICTED: uncharacterized protein LOC105969404 [Erythranthe guttata]EYU27107.1 hypothetical protein MIMGU_mgv1a010663mg [Erythranthe guttata]|eukprot:XP_012849611.1 PREDICTED: uncharacterized protein LOC105969404 [Erythranthe guttata]